MARFAALGVLALLFGRSILRWADNDVVQGVLIGFVVVCLVGSAISVYGWIRRSRGNGRREPARQEARRTA